MTIKQLHDGVYFIQNDTQVLDLKHTRIEEIYTKGDYDNPIFHVGEEPLSVYLKRIFQKHLTLT